MTNISHVKKYKQVNLYFLALIFFVLTNILSNVYGIERNGETASGRTSGSASGRTGGSANKWENSTELSLEISEKYYKKDAILKFNDAVKKWEEKSVFEAVIL